MWGEKRMRRTEVDRALGDRATRGERFALASRSPWGDLPLCLRTAGCSPLLLLGRATTMAAGGRELRLDARSSARGASPWSYHRAQHREPRVVPEAIRSAQSKLDPRSLARC